MNLQCTEAQSNRETSFCFCGPFLTLAWVFFIYFSSILFYATIRCSSFVGNETGILRQEEKSSIQRRRFMIDKILWRKKPHLVSNDPQKRMRRVFSYFFAELIYLSRNAHNTTAEPTVRFIAKKRSASYCRMQPIDKIDKK